MLIHGEESREETLSSPQSAALETMLTRDQETVSDH